MHKKKIAIHCFLLVVYNCAIGQNWDIDIAKKINPQDPHSRYWRFTSASTYMFSAAIPASFMVAGFISDDQAVKKKAVEILGAVVVEFVVSESMKLGFDRQRPAEKYPALIFPYKQVHGQSFPSGHTSLAFAAAASLSIQCKKWWVTVPAYAWAGSVGYSRIYLGVHYPSDVIGGAAVGIGSAYLANWLNHRLFPAVRKAGLAKAIHE